MEFQWRRRYGLPPTDPRFLQATREEILVDWWAHQHADDPELYNEVRMDDADFQREAEAMLAEAMAAAEADPPQPADDWEEVAAFGEPEP